MKHFTLFSIFLVLTLNLQAQKVKINQSTELPTRAEQSYDQTPNSDQSPLKGAGDIFWEEQFDWGDSTSGIGWFLPEGWTIEDPGDLGYNWHWANDTLFGTYTIEPPFYSTTADNGFLALNLDGYNADILDYADYLAVNSSIVSPVIDCSGKSSVLVRIEQRFRYWSNAVMLFEVTNDNGVHWASFDMSMGTLISETSGAAPARTPVDLYLNLNDVAAGMPEVQFKITWRESRLYFWMIDDISFMEGWDHDLQMLYYEADYDNGLDDPEGFFYQVPKTQISGYNFYSVVKNFGNNEQWGTNMNVKIMKNNEYIWDKSTDPYISYSLLTDTLILEDQFVPEDYGHYQIDFAITSEVEDEKPADNYASILFNITDSVFSRGDDTREVNFSTWDWYSSDHEGDYMGTWYTLKQDEEINSISAYISYADVNYDVSFSVFAYDDELGEPYELLTTEMVTIDSTILENKWLTLPIEKDGEGEFLEAGKSYMVAVYFTSGMTYEEGYDSRRFGIGSDRSNYYPSGQCWYYFAVDDEWYPSGSDLFMIKMNLNNNDNIIDSDNALNLAGSSLNQNYPNPFVDQTNISFVLDKAQEVELIVTDITGKTVYYRQVGTVQAGENVISLQASGLKPGNYFYTVKGDSFRETKRMTISR